MHTEKEKLEAAYAAMAKEGWPVEFDNGVPLLLSEGNLGVACFKAGYDLASGAAASYIGGEAAAAEPGLLCLAGDLESAIGKWGEGLIQLINKAETTYEYDYAGGSDAYLKANQVTSTVARECNNLIENLRKLDARQNGAAGRVSNTIGVEGRNSPWVSGAERLPVAGRRVLLLIAPELHGHDAIEIGYFVQHGDGKGEVPGHWSSWETLAFGDVIGWQELPFATL
jgi:hypothetical protein